MTATKTVRSLTQGELEALSVGDRLDCFRLDRDGVLLPGVADVELVRAVTEDGEVTDSYRPGRNSAPIGKVLSFKFRSMFGLETGGRIFTTPPAQRAVGMGREVLTLSLYVECSDDEAKDPESATFPVADVWGSQVTLAAFVGDAVGSPEEVRHRVVRAIIAEFASDGLPVRVHRSKARPVRNEPVAVIGGDGTVVATNVMRAEAQYIAPINEAKVVPMARHALEY